MTHLVKRFRNTALVTAALLGSAATTARAQSTGTITGADGTKTTVSLDGKNTVKAPTHVAPVTPPVAQTPVQPVIKELAPVELEAGQTFDTTTEGPAHLHVTAVPASGGVPAVALSSTVAALPVLGARIPSDQPHWEYRNHHYLYGHWIHTGKMVSSLKRDKDHANCYVPTKVPGMRWVTDEVPVAPKLAAAPAPVAAPPAPPAPITQITNVNITCQDGQVYNGVAGGQPLNVACNVAAPVVIQSSSHAVYPEQLAPAWGSLMVEGLIPGSDFKFKKAFGGLDIGAFIFECIGTTAKQFIPVPGITVEWPFVSRNLTKPELENINKIASLIPDDITTYDGRSVHLTNDQKHLAAYKLLSLISPEEKEILKARKHNRTTDIQVIEQKIDTGALNLMKEPVIGAAAYWIEFQMVSTKRATQIQQMQYAKPQQFTP